MYGKNNSGYKHTEEHKERMSNLFKGAKNPMYGKTHSDIFSKTNAKNIDLFMITKRLKCLI
jgi:hypothetical protein